MITAAILKNIHTKVLLKALRSTRAHQSHTNKIIAQEAFDDEWRDATDDDVEARGTPFLNLKDTESIVDAYLLGYVYDDHTPSSITVAQLKSELATREHVPNKLEAKEIRKKKALAGKNKGKKDK
jgi:hypothetical protein